MQRFKKAVAAIGVTLALTMGGAGLAAPAQANSIGHPDYYKINCTWDQKVYYTWKDYSWWDEFWNFKRDGYVVYYVAYYPC